MTSHAQERSNHTLSSVYRLCKMHGSCAFVSFVGGASTMSAGIIGMRALKSPR